MRRPWNRAVSAVGVAGSHSTAWHAALFALIFCLGCFARLWEFGTVPPGLSADEASDGVEAMSLYRYGTDRNGESFPVRFIGWGSGQDALDSYVLIPLVAIAGLSPRVVRLPLLIAGILALPLIYFIGRKLQGRVLGLLTMLLLAISPWHIVISRTGPEADLLPLLFLLGFACLLASDAGNHWFIPACVFFGLGLYSYITSYLAIPLFLLLAVPPAYLARRISIKDLIAGILLFMILAVPAGLHVIVNTFDLPTIHIGLMTIPHLPSVSRLQSDVAVFQPMPLKQLLINVEGFLSLLVTQSESAYNQPGYGYLYNVTFPLVFAGAMLFVLRRADRFGRRLVFAWLVAATCVGVLIAPYFVHNNLLFMPLLLFCALFLEWLLHWNKIVFALSVVAFLAGFILFTDYYHGPVYKQQADREYFTGLLSALDYARTSSSNAICVSRPKINEPYIFALFSEQMAPSVSPDKIVYVNSAAQYREVSSVGRYFFGLQNCPSDKPSTYVLFFNEPPPTAGKAFTVRQFGLYKVYLPK
jgi:hypothetical protein